MSDDPDGARAEQRTSEIVDHAQAKSARKHEQDLKAIKAVKARASLDKARPRAKAFVERAEGKH